MTDFWAAPAGHQVVRALLEANPQACAEVDSNGRMPLHHAAAAVCSAADPEAVVRALVEAHPAAAEHADGQGMRPARLAESAGASRDVLALM